MHIQRVSKVSKITESWNPSSADEIIKEYHYSLYLYDMYDIYSICPYVYHLETQMKKISAAQKSEASRCYPAGEWGKMTWRERLDVMKLHFGAKIVQVRKCS